MSEPRRLSYNAPEEYPSGMVSEETAGTGGWPFRAARWAVPPGQTSELDQHDVAEVWMVRTGTGTVRSAGTTLDVRPGEMVFLASQVPHQVTNTGTDPLEMFSVWWKGTAG